MSSSTLPDFVQQDIDKLASAPEAYLRSIVAAFCLKEDGFRKWAVQMLNRMETLRSKTEADDSDVQLCVHCNESFDVNCNSEAVCTYHPGEMEIDEEASVWDTIEDCDEHDPDQDSEQNKGQLPEGFRWDCCSKRGDEPGCETTPHVSGVRSKSLKQSPAGDEGASRVGGPEKPIEV